MSIIMNRFFANELTGIPGVLDKYIGQYYSNTVTNGVTWTFFMWTLLHYWFDKSINKMLRKMSVKEHVRTRLKRSLWYCGFHGASFFYCLATILRNNIDVLSYRTGLALDQRSTATVPGHLILGLILISGFLLHSFVYELLQYGSFVKSANYGTLFTAIVYTYCSRKIELYLYIVAISCLTKFITEFFTSTIALMSCTFKKRFSLLLDIILAGNILSIVLMQLILFSIFFIYPLRIYMYQNHFTFTSLVLNEIILVWMISELFNSPVYKFVIHWLNHSQLIDERICPGSRIDCALFEPRDDFSFNMKLIRQETAAREAKMKSKKRPKHQGLLTETLKCMMTLKRKMKEKQQTNLKKAERLIDERIQQDSDEKIQQDSDDNLQQDSDDSLQQDSDDSSSSENE